MKSILRALPLFLFTAVFCAGVVPPPITFTFTAINTSAYDPGAYQVGQTYTFSFTTGASFDDNGSSQFYGPYNQWAESGATHQPLITGVGGTGLMGLYVRPSAADYDPDSYINAQLGSVSMHIGALISNISATDFLGSPITAIDAATNFNGPFTTPQNVPYQEPNTYFASFVGEYDIAGSVHVYALAGASHFSVSHVSITTAAIPEPATSAALVGVGVMVLSLWRRGRASRAVKTRSLAEVK